MGAMLLAALLLQGAAPARPPASDQDLPKWAKTPSAEDMAKAYPPEASKANLAGSGVIECVVDTGGEMKDCVVVSETPPGQGFGPAALSIAGKFTLPTKAPSGATTVGRTVRVPIRWRNAAKTQAPPIVIYDETGRTGHVIFDCRVTATKTYDNCVVVDAKPPGTALFSQAGEAALRQQAPSSAKAGQRLMVVVQVRQN